MKSFSSLFATVFLTWTGFGRGLRQEAAQTSSHSPKEWTPPAACHRVGSKKQSFDFKCEVWETQGDSETLCRFVEDRDKKMLWVTICGFFALGFV